MPCANTLNGQVPCANTLNGPEKKLESMEMYILNKKSYLKDAHAKYNMILSSCYLACVFRVTLMKTYLILLQIYSDV